MRLLVLGVAFALGCGGNPARDAALARAKAAHAHGDLVGEALALRDACAAARDDKDVCKRADQAGQAAHAASQQSARAACADVAPTLAAVDACLAAVAQIRALAPNDPDAARFADAAARQHVARCASDSPDARSSITAAIEQVRCLAARADAIALAGYAQHLLAARADTRDQLLHLADDPALADRHGAHAELLAAATCLAPTAELVQRARSARAELADHARAAIDLRATQSMPLPDLCGATAASLGGRAVCGAPRPKAPQLTIIGEVELAPVEHTAFDSAESQRYVAGIIRFENPEYQPAVNEERSARQARDQVESTFRRDEADCRSAESALSSQSSSCSSSCPARDERDRACNRKSSSESMYRSRQSDWESASRRLANTPSMSEREDIRTATYSVRHHRWRAAWRAQFRSDARAVPANGEVTAADDETAGAPVAGVPSDPMTSPGNRWFITGIRDQVAARLAEIADTGLQRRASDLAASCLPPARWTADWLDCWARSRFWAGAAPDLDALLRVAGETAWQPVRCSR